MATLIPRKQIEEQKEFTASVDIGGDLRVSGSFILSQSFTMGSNPLDENQITGSVLVSGSLIIDGDIQFDDIDQILNLTASQALQSQDTFKYAGILARDFGANVPTLYVSATDGDDNNDGRSIQFPLRTVKRACQLATPGFDGRYGLPSGSLFSGYVIRVQAGTYFENNPVIVPKNTSIWGSGLRITKINALNKEEDLFHLNSGCYVAEITVGNLRLWPNEKEPERGFGFAFQPGAFITTSPYIQNCSQISNQENSFTELYEDIPPGGGGLYVNGDVIHPDSPLASMVLDAYTQISPNGVGCLVNGRGFIQLVSFFTNFAYYAIRVNNGGHATLNNSNISFGLFGMYASGSRKIDAIEGGNEDARLAVRESYSVIVDVLNKGLEEGLPSITKLNTDEGIKVTQFTQSFSNDLATQTEANQVSEDFRIISEIVQFGPNDYPPLIAKSGIRGYSIDSPFNISGGEQFTSSVVASVNDLEQISGSYRDLLSIFEDGTGSFTFKSNAEDGIKVTELTASLPVISGLAPDSTEDTQISSSFSTIINIVNGGNIPNIIKNTDDGIYLSGIEPTLPENELSSSIISEVSSSFSIIYNILNNGTGSPILDIPEDHQREFVVSRGVNNSAWIFGEDEENPTIQLFRGETYKFNVSGSFGKFTNPFFIRTQPISGFIEGFDYNSGVINNGDDFGLITFTVPFDAPNELFYVSQNSPNMLGKFVIVNNSQTPFSLIESNMTYPTLVERSPSASLDEQIITASALLNTNLNFIKAETIEYVSSSWAGFDYDEETCKRDIGFIIDAVSGDLLFGGNSGSITAGLEYYLQPSMATDEQKQPTLTAVKYLSDLSLNLLQSASFQIVDIESDEKYDLRSSIIRSKPFVEAEVIQYISSSWSEFEYDEIKCKRDVGFILNAVATDLLYGGNERSVTAGRFYFDFPSEATETQLSQTTDGIRYAYGVITKILQGITHIPAEASTLASVEVLRKNRSLIQDETIEFINATFPTLDYNQQKCRRDVGFIIDAIITDLLYGGNERSIIAGRFYYDIPSIATSRQKRETRAGIQYSQVLAEFIVQNIILETPKVSLNTELGIKITDEQFFSSSISGSVEEGIIVHSNFGIIGDIIKNGIEKTSAAIAKNKSGWDFDNPFNVTNDIQFISGETLVDYTEEIGSGFGIVADIVEGGLGVKPQLIKSIESLTKVNNIEQVTGSFVENSVTQSISASFATVVNIISNGVEVIPTLIPNTAENIIVGNISPITSSVAYTEFSSSISASFGLIQTIISGGLDVSPDLVKNTENNIYIGSINPFTSSLIATSTEIEAVSSSFAIVLGIVENGTGSLPDIIEYTTASSNPIVLNVYNNIKQNIPFIQQEVIAYLSSSWSEFVYDEVSCSRDVGFIVSGAAEDLLFNSNSSSIANGIAYYEFPSSAIISGSGSPSEDAQLLPTLEGIRYAKELTLKLIQNEEFVRSDEDKVEVGNLLFNNKNFLREEAIEYISSSWSFFNYDEDKCKRDIGFIIDAVRTDLVYGGNQRGITAGEYYYLIPSLATTTQIFQTLDAIKYVSTLSQKLVSGEGFVEAEPQNLEASRLLLENNELIAREVVSYVSSSWSEVVYNEDSCSRDVKYILDAVRTDLVYGGNERSITAGEFYFIFPSAATVGGVPSETAQLDPTVTGIEYGSELAQKIVLSKVLELVPQSLLDTYEVVFNNKQLIKNNTIEYINNFFPLLKYNSDKCSRDVGFILDGVLTDLVYGGNQRSITSGEFYFRFPSIATSEQKAETVDGILYAGELAKLVSLNTIIPTIEIQQNIDNTIRVTDTSQFVSTQSGSINEVNAVSSSIGIILNIVKNGVDVIPTIIDNTENGIKITNIPQYTTTSFVGNDIISKVSSSFATVLEIVKNGTDVIPTIVNNVVDNIKVTNVEQITSSLSASQNDIDFVSSSFTIVLDIVENGTGSYTASNYGLPSTDVNTIAAYDLLKANIPFIQSETIAYISSSWRDFTYNEESCSRDVGFIVSGAAEDLLHNTVSASVVSGKFYYEFPSSATVSGSESPNETAQLYPTLDGIRYASRLAEKIIQNVLFVTASEERVVGGELLLRNLNLIKEETITYISSSWSDFSYNEDRCKRDIGFIIDAVRTDLVYGGNERTVTAGEFYYKFPSAAIISGSGSPTVSAQLYPTLDGIGYAGRLSDKLIQNIVLVNPINEVSASNVLLKENKDFIKTETIAYISSSWSDFSYNEESCSRDIGFIIDAVRTDLVYGGNQRSSTAGEFYFLFPSAATISGSLSPNIDAQLFPTLDGIRYAGRVAEKVVGGEVFVTASQEVSASVNLLRNNRRFIQREVIEYVSSSWSQVVYNEESCSRDVGFLVDAVTTDLLYGGEERSVTAGDFYYRFPSRATVAGVPSEEAQLDPTLTGVRYAGKISSRIVLGKEFTFPSQSAINGRALLMSNKEFIQKETIAYLSSSWSTFDYNEVSCSRDLGFILDAVSTDLVYGGNESSIKAGTFYYLIPSVAILDSISNKLGQRQQTTDGINFARGLSVKVVEQTQLVFPGERRREAAERLFDAKDELKRRALSYTNGAFPDLVYNEASCSRDTGFIVDALVTDLLYGGNERAIIAASSYFNGQFGSAATVVNEQRLETLETNRYLRTRAEFIAANAPKEDFGSLIVATGIDYSYNGSGVTFKALPPNQGGSGVPNPDFEITELGGGRIFFTSGNQDGDFRIGTGLSINQATGTLVGRTFSKSLFSLVTPFSLALEG
jgi:hypothetical protein